MIFMTKLNDATPEEWDAVRKEYLNKIADKLFEDDDPANVEWVDSIRPNMVDSPAHYNKGGIECIEYIKQQLGDCFTEYCEGNVIKYLHRWRYKNGTEDLKKAQWYLNEMIEWESE